MRATSDLSDEGIGDTFVSIRSHAHMLAMGTRDVSHSALQRANADVRDVALLFVGNPIQ